MTNSTAFMLFILTTIGIGLIVVPLWPKIVRKLDPLVEFFGSYTHNIIHAQPFEHLLILEKARDNKVRTFRLLLGHKTWALLLVQERPKDD